MKNRLEINKHHKKALVIGGGLSGFGASLLLRRLGLEVNLSEHRAVSPNYVQRLKRENVEIFENGHQEGHISDCDLVVVSPGVPPNNLLLSIARDRKITMLSEIDLALDNYHGTVLGVTGTNGKSTICAMAEHALKRLGFDAKAGGNFGDPPSLMIAEDRAPALLVLELSSYQLELSTHFKAASVSFTNFSQDHLARHGSMEDYFRVKWSIFDHLEGGGLGIFTEDLFKKAQSLRLPTPKNHCIIDNVLVAFKSPIFKQFPHNIINAKSALSLIHPVVNRDFSDICNALEDFKGLPFRCQNIGDHRGVPIYNDSKSTNVDSTITALNGFNESIILMLGGQGKGESFEPIRKHRNIIKYVVTFGYSGKSIQHDLSNHIHTAHFDKLKDAIDHLKEFLKTNKYPVLFSPGCASFDEFKNYEHRGNFFNQHILGE